jgi:hypothetical protein
MKSKVNRIRILAGSEPHERIFAVSRTVMDKLNRDGVPIIQVLSESHVLSYGPKGQGLSDASMGAVNKLISVQGVLSLNFRKHHVTIVKALAWDWAEIQPEILSILRSEYFNDAFDNVQIDDTTSGEKSPAVKR